MLEITLVRHGETDWNVGEVFRGRADVGLNETGLRQAELLGEYLSGSGVRAVYSSPLRRALKTAEAVADCHGLEVNIAPGLIDFDYGEWQGLSRREVKEKYQELYAEWLAYPDRVRMPGGEGLEDVRERGVAVLCEVMESHREGGVVLVSHRVVNKVLICVLLGLDDSHFWNIRMDTCGITTFSRSGGRLVLTRHNDTSHLKPVPDHRLADF
jgi:broad specificity phosphatase PhoE